MNLIVLIGSGAVGKMTVGLKMIEEEQAEKEAKRNRARD